MISYLFGSILMHFPFSWSVFIMLVTIQRTSRSCPRIQLFLCMTPRGLCSTLFLSLSRVIILIIALFSFEWAKRIVAAKGNLPISGTLWPSVVYGLELAGGLHSLALHSSVHLAKMLIKGKNSSYSYQSQSISSALSVWRI